MLLTWQAASLPEAMATEQSASLSAMRVVDAVPVMATVCFFCFSASTSFFFCSGSRAEHGVRLRRLGQLRVVRQRARVHIPLRAGDAGALRHSETVSGLSPEMTLPSRPAR